MAYLPGLYKIFFLYLLTRAPDFLSWFRNLAGATQRIKIDKIESQVAPLHNFTLVDQDLLMVGFISFFGFAGVPSMQSYAMEIVPLTIFSFLGLVHIGSKQQKLIQFTPLKNGVNNVCSYPSFCSSQGYK